MALKEITIQNLNSEYSKWTAENGMGRNIQDLRFGQYIWNNYDLDKVFAERNSGTDGFSTENPMTALEIISNQLIKNK